MKKADFFIKYNLLIKALNYNSSIWIKWKKDHIKFKKIQAYLIKLGFKKLKRKEDIIKVLYEIKHLMVKKIEKIGKNKVKKEKIKVKETNWISDYQIYENQELKIWKNIVRYHKPLKSKNKKENKKENNYKIQLDKDVLTKKKYNSNKIENILLEQNIENIFLYLLKFKKELL